MTRNEELFRQVADQIEREPEKYDQLDLVNDCGTTACIAGWAVSLSVLGGSLSALADTLHRNAAGPWDDPQDLLGLTHDEAWGAGGRGLFNPSWRPHDGLSVPDALRKIGEGAEISDVSA